MNSTRAGSLCFLSLLLLSPLAQAAMPDRDPYNEPFADRPCDLCSDLCALVDQYLQKEKGIELWRQFAASTPREFRAELPAGVTEMVSIENHVMGELDKWAKTRSLPCKTMQEVEAERGNPNPTPPRNTVRPGLETRVFTEACDIVYGNEKLEGVTEKVFRGTHVCRGSAEAEIEHEKVHQKHCKDIWARNRFLATKRLDTPRNVAQSELEAWTRHKELLGEQIRNLASKCGWQPTKLQRAIPDSVPSAAQTKEMEKRGWKAFDALTSTP